MRKTLALTLLAIVVMSVLAGEATRVSATDNALVIGDASADPGRTITVINTPGVYTTYAPITYAVTTYTTFHGGTFTFAAFSNANTDGTGTILGAPTGHANSAYVGGTNLITVFGDIDKGGVSAISTAGNYAAYVSATNPAARDRDSVCVNAAGTTLSDLTAVNDANNGGSMVAGIANRDGRFRDFNTRTGTGTPDCSSGGASDAPNPASVTGYGGAV